MIQLAVFASGAGSNAENLVRYFAGNKEAIVSMVVSNNPNAGVHERMKRLGVPTFTFSNEEFVAGEPVLKKLAEYDIDWIILAGFLKKIPGEILTRYPNRIVNIHPALLPKYGGKGMYGMNVHKAVVEAGERETGITIHYINENYDEGPAIFQAKCLVLSTDSPQDVADKIHKLEQTHFPEVIEQLIKNTNK